jgi:hypothetical protein
LDLRRASIGLQAAELDLLRSAPDYDAEEMATVRPSGGWPSSLSVADLAEPPPPPSWLPPNRIEPPVRASLPPVEAPARASVLSSSEAAAARTRFPEERTVALMAEDLLGRPLDEPKPPATVAAQAPASVPRLAWNDSTAGTDIWDSAMPLLAEG